MPTSPLPRLKLASMQALALMTRASSPSDGSLNTTPHPPGGRELMLVAMSGVLIGGIARGTGLPCPLVRQRPTGDHQPLFGADPLALDARLHPTPHHLDLYRPFLPVSHRQMPPRIGGKAFPPLRPCCALVRLCA